MKRVTNKLSKNINKCEFKVRNYLSAQRDGRVIL